MFCNSLEASDLALQGRLNAFLEPAFSIVSRNLYPSLDGAAIGLIMSAL